MATPTTDYTSIRNWLTKAASLPEKEDEGKPATLGAHAAQDTADANKAVPGTGAQEAKKNPETGHADNPVPGSGLLQATTGKMPEVEKAVKTVTEASEKAANADLSTDEGFEFALSEIRKAAAEFPVIFAQSGLKVDAPAKAAPAAKAAATADPAAAAKAAQDAQAAAVIDGYRKLGADRGGLTAEYLKAFYATYGELEKMANDGSMGAMLAADPAAQGGPPMPGGAPEGPPPGPPAPEAAPAPGGPPAGPGGEAGPSLDDVAAALAEMGMTPDDLMQIAQKMKGEAEAAPAPDAGGPPAEQKEAAVASMAHVIKTAGDAKALMQAGKFALKPAADDSADRKRRNAAKAYIQELRALAAA